MGDGEGAQLSHGGPTWEGTIGAEGGAGCWEAKGVRVSGEASRPHLGPLVARCPALKSTVYWSHILVHTCLLVSRPVAPTPRGQDGEGTRGVSCSPGDRTSTPWKTVPGQGCSHWVLLPNTALATQCAPGGRAREMPGCGDTPTWGMH